jgi:hypothetical protein
VQRARDHDVVQSLRLTWPLDLNNDAAGRLLAPLFAHLGPASAEGVEGTSLLRFRWQDERTRVELHLPYDEKPPVLVVEDIQPASAGVERLRLARSRDEAERQQRLRDNQARRRLPRSPGTVNGLSLAGLKLGASRAEAKAALPRGKSYRVKEVPGGLSLLDLRPPFASEPHWANQVLVRFDARDQVSEVRVRYREGLAAGKKGTLLARLSDVRNGAPEVLPSRWAGLWSDRPAREPAPVLYRWQDDVTVRTCEQDADGSEVVLRDRSGPGESAPWRFLAQGLPGCALGDTRASVEAAWKKPAAASGGASVYRQPATSAYQMVLVWYQADRVSRIVAVHRGDVGAEEKAVTGALKRAWGQHIDGLGAVRRQEGRRDPVLGAFFWHDDRTRVQVFVRLEDGTGRLLTEWREWPVPGAKPADGD